MLHPQRHCGAFRLSYHLCVARVGRIPEDGHAREAGNDLLQKLQLFSAYLWGKRGQSSNVPTWPRQTGDEPVANGIIIEPHDNGNLNSCFLGGTGWCRTTRDDDIYVEPHEFGREFTQTSWLPLCISILNDNVFALHVTKLAQTLAECLPASRASGREVSR